MVCLEASMSGYINMLMKINWKSKQSIYKGYSIIERIYTKANKDIKIVGITRVRNEELILQDTLNHIGEIADIIIALDDDSSDKTKSILKANKKVVKIISKVKWVPERVEQETEHRKILFEEAKKFNPEWVFYFDADERFQIEREQLLKLPNNVDGVRVQLYDAYITQDDVQPYKKGDNLWNFRRYFGPECRDILMVFRCYDGIEFVGLDSREPVGCKNTVTMFYCQHYGKAISIEQWEETCDYYSRYFPEPYASKWESRKSKAIHTKSDFDTDLIRWDEIQHKGIKIYP